MAGQLTMGIAELKIAEFADGLNFTKRNVSILTVIIGEESRKSMVITRRGLEVGIVHYGGRSCFSG